MSTEKLINENSKILTNTKFDLSGSEKKFSDPQISNLNLNKVKNNIFKKKKIKTCINILQETLRKKEVKKQFENRILYGLFISVVAVLFYVST
jgi:dephospho-CoA kinase